MFEALKAYATLIKDGLFALAFVGVVAGMWHLGAEHVRGQWTAADNVRLEAEKRATAQRLAENAVTAARHELETKTLKKGYEDEIATIQRDAANSGRMQRNPGICAGSPRPAETESAGRGDAPATGTGALPQTDAGDSGELMPEKYQLRIDALQDEADKVVASCRVAQKFITDNGFAP